METCILLSTCDRYIDLARLTTALIHQRWKDHPPVFVCGVSHPFRGDVETFPLVNHPQDWIGIAESAVHSLIEKGYKKCYLILDDHPPLGACNDVHLNHTLPALMDRLEAAYIGLHGWGQNTLSEGIMLGVSECYLQQQSDMFLWRYALHPALWDLRAFRDIAGALPILGDDMASRSVWAFERRAGASPSPIPPMWHGRSYRIFGLGMLGERFGLMHGVARWLMYALLNLLFFGVKRIFGTTTQEKLVSSIVHELLFYNGPYPIYWSGVMQKGGLHKNFEKYMVSHNQDAELLSFKGVLPPKSGTPSI